MKNNVFSLLIKAFLIEMIVFHMISYDFESFSYEGGCILNNFLTISYEFESFSYDLNAFSIFFFRSLLFFL